MIITVDANILFSALITPKGKLAEILTYPNDNGGERPRLPLAKH